MAPRAPREASAHPRPARPARRAAILLGLAFTAGLAATGSAVAGRNAGAQSPADHLAAVRQPPPTAAGRLAEPVPTPPGTTERVSIADGEAQGNALSGGVSTLIESANGDQAISADGRWVAFVSSASNLTPGTNQLPGRLYLRDRVNGATSAVPWIDGGALPQGFVAAEPAISADGGVVAFTVIVSGGGSGIFSGSQPTPYVFAWDR